MKKGLAVLICILILFFFYMTSYEKKEDINISQKEDFSQAILFLEKIKNCDVFGLNEILAHEINPDEIYFGNQLDQLFSLKKLQAGYSLKGAKRNEDRLCFEAEITAADYSYALENAHKEFLLCLNKGEVSISDYPLYVYEKLSECRDNMVISAYFEIDGNGKVYIKPEILNTILTGNLYIAYSEKLDSLNDLNKDSNKEENHDNHNPGDDKSEPESSTQEKGPSVKEENSKPPEVNIERPNNPSGLQKDPEIHERPYHIFNSLYVCEICSRMFQSKINFDGHDCEDINRVRYEYHLENMFFVCNSCRGYFLSVSEINNHSCSKDIHEHCFVPEYHQVLVPEEGHYEEGLIKEAYYEEIYAEKVICKNCSAGFVSDSECAVHIAKEHDNTGSFTVQQVVIDRIYHEAEFGEIYVIDKQGFYDNQIYRYRCEICGEYKYKE